MDLDIKIKDFEKQDFIVASEKSSLSNIDDAREGLFNWIKEYKLVDITGEFMFSFTPPDENHDYMYLEIMVQSQQHSTSSFKIIQEMDQKIVSGIYKGPYINLRHVHQIIRDYYKCK